jgi:hypothetical protein
MPAAAGSAIGYRGNAERRRGDRDPAPVTVAVAEVAGRRPAVALQDPVGSCTTALVVQEPFVPVTG